MHIVARIIRGISLLAMSVRTLVNVPVLLLLPVFIACLTRILTIIMLLFRVSHEMQYIVHYYLFSYCAYFVYAYVVCYSMQTARDSQASYEESMMGLVNRIFPLIFFASINSMVTAVFPLLFSGAVSNVYTLMLIGWSVCTLPLIPLLLEYEPYLLVALGPRAMLELIPHTWAIARTLWAEAFCGSVIFQSMYWLLARVDYTVFGSYAVIAGMFVVYLCYLIAILDGIFTATVYHQSSPRR